MTALDVRYLPRQMHSTCFQTVSLTTTHLFLLNCEIVGEELGDSSTDDSAKLNVALASLASGDKLIGAGNAIFSSSLKV